MKNSFHIVKNELKIKTLFSPTATVSPVLKKKVLIGFAAAVWLHIHEQKQSILTILMQYFKLFLYFLKYTII